MRLTRSRRSREALPRVPPHNGGKCEPAVDTMSSQWHDYRVSCLERLDHDRSTSVPPKWQNSEADSDASSLSMTVIVGLLMVMATGIAAVVTRIVAVGVGDTHILRTLQHLSAAGALLGSAVFLWLGWLWTRVERKTYRPVAFGCIIRRDLPREIIERLHPAIRGLVKDAWPELKAEPLYPIDGRYRHRPWRELHPRMPGRRLVAVPDLPSGAGTTTDQESSPADPADLRDIDCPISELTQREGQGRGCLLIRMLEPERLLSRLFCQLALDRDLHDAYRRQWHDAEKALDSLTALAADCRGGGKATARYESGVRARARWGASRGAVVAGFVLGFGYSAYRVCLPKAHPGHSAIGLRLVIAGVLLGLIAIAWLALTVAERRQKSEELLSTSELLDACFLQDNNAECLVEIARNKSARSAYELKRLAMPARLEDDPSVAGDDRRTAR
jgi:hypothetical protein